MTENLFFELIQVSVGVRDSLQTSPSDEQWRAIYETSKQQAVMGVCFIGVQHLPKDQLPPGKIIRQWAVKADKVVGRNYSSSAGSKMVCDRLQRDGFNSILLKGQGNRSYYPPQLRDYRSPGDIDVWVWPGETHKDCHRPIRCVIDYCQSIQKGEFIYYHDMDWPLLQLPVEVHYRPTWLFNPWRNRRLQRWLKAHRDYEEFEGYHIPTPEFNVIFQMLHLYKHIFEEGIGLRQLVDYYFVLRRFGDDASDSERETVHQSLSSFGLKNFSAAVMYVMRVVFAMSDEYLLCSPDESAGQLLLEEIMIGGNFGKFDERYNWSEVTNDSLEFRGSSYAVTRFRHNRRFLRHYPEEVLWEPLFRIYHFLWRRLKLWRWE